MKQSGGQGGPSEPSFPHTVYRIRGCLSVETVSSALNLRVCVMANLSGPFPSPCTRVSLPESIMSKACHQFHSRGFRRTYLGHKTLSICSSVAKSLGRALGERERDRCTLPGISLVQQVQGEVRLKAMSNNTHMVEKHTGWSPSMCPYEPIQTGCCQTKQKCHRFKYLPPVFFGEKK